MSCRQQRKATWHHRAGVIGNLPVTSGAKRVLDSISMHKASSFLIEHREKSLILSVTVTWLASVTLANRMPTITLTSKQFAQLDTT